MRRSVCAGLLLNPLLMSLLQFVASEEIPVMRMERRAVSGRKLFMEIDYPVYPDAQQQKETAINNPIEVNDFRQIIFIVEYLEIVCSI